MVRIHSRNKIIIFAILVLYSTIISAESFLAKHYDLSILQDHFGQMYGHFITNSLDVGEKTVTDNSNSYRMNEGYHEKYLYVVEAIEQSMFGTHALSKHDIERGEKWHRQAINSLINGKHDHFQKLQQEKQSKETWLNLAMIAFSSIANYKMGKAGYIGAPLIPTWINLDIDISDIPEAETMSGYYGNDIRRFPVLPGTGFLAAIGRIKNSKGYCTGSLVSPRIALTNWHCVSDSMTLMFERLYETRSYTVIKYLTFNGWNVPYDEEFNHSTNFRNDWALLVLDRDVPTPPLRIQSRFTTKMLRSLQKRLFIAGYSGDLDAGKFLTADYGCSPTDYLAPENNYSGVVKNDCRKDKGSSGSPVLISGTDRIVSLHAFGIGPMDATGKQRITCSKLDKCIGGGPDMSVIYKKLREVRGLIINNQI
ncbi:MAG: trypsin-like serine protease [Candidatus Thiodiazotropha endolucinida]